MVLYKGTVLKKILLRVSVVSECRVGGGAPAVKRVSVVSECRVGGGAPAVKRIDFYLRDLV